LVQRRRTAALALGALLAAGAVRSQPGGTPVGREAPELLREVRLVARTAPESLTVGDRLTLEVLVDAPAGWRVTLPDRAALGADVELEDVVLQPPSGERRDAPGRATWVGRYTLVPFAVGPVVLPPWPVEVRAESLWAVTQTDSIRFEVRSVLDDSLAQADLRDLKPQATLAASPWPWIVGGLALLLAVLLLVWWLRRRKRPRAAVVPLVPPRPADVVALEALRRLEAERLPVDGLFTEYHVRLSEILRRYLEDAFGVAALEETTGEICADLRRHGFAEPVVDEVADLCSESDLVKFAKHEPTIESCMQALERVRGFVQRTAAAPPAPALRPLMATGGAAGVVSAAAGAAPREERP
jgi:hypothetical protein